MIAKWRRPILNPANNSDLWAKRLTIPNYRVTDAARYAHTTAATIRSWQRLQGNHSSIVGARDQGAALSYMQLVEVAVVKACREAGMPLRRIREAREYISGEFKTDYPFARHRFATDGKHLLMEYGKGAGGDVTWLGADQKGQLAWDRIIGPSLRTFEYEKDLAVRWRVAGENSPIIIDPRIAFGEPSIHGLPTWLFRERWQAGEPLNDTAKDLGIKVADVRQALQFERVDLNAPQPDPSLH